jgi:hypothetical protein
MASLASSPSHARAVALGVASGVAALAVIALARRRAGEHELELARDALGNESLVAWARVAGRRALVMVDTAYAGPPVLSTSYLALQGRCESGGLPSWPSAGEAHARCTRALRAEVREDDRHAAIAALLRDGACRAFTSGCTMRLMGIGTTTEAQADMLLCAGVRLAGGDPNAPAGVGGVDADVFVTHPLHGSVHILTNDFLLHRAPCVVEPRAGRLRFGLPPLAQLRLRPTFELHPAVFVGGAFAVPMDVGGVTLRIVVDTGAAAALSLGRSAADRLATCGRGATARHATQAGVNGERVCSDVLSARVAIGSIAFEDVEVFANATEVEGAHGYAGMGLLRAVDLWLEPTAIGFRRSGLAPRRSDATAPGDCGRPLPQCAA